MKRWIGRFLVAVGFIHTLFGVIVFKSTLAILFHEGFFNTVNGQSDRELAFWFISFGVLAMILGWCMDWIESQGTGFPRSLGWILLIFALIVIIIMPISGGWLILFPAIGALRRA